MTNKNVQDEDKYIWEIEAPGKGEDFPPLNIIITDQARPEVGMGITISNQDFIIAGFEIIEVSTAYNKTQVALIELLHLIKGNPEQ